MVGYRNSNPGGQVRSTGVDGIGLGDDVVIYGGGRAELMGLMVHRRSQQVDTDMNKYMPFIQYTARTWCTL